MRLRKQNGFTLIELMITVAIVAILATIAYPSYQDQVRKSRRAEAKAALLDAQQKMERLFTERGSYATGSAGTTFPSSSEHGYYTIGFSAGPIATTYTLTATRAGAQANDDCGNLTLTQAGAKGLASAGSGKTVATCW